MHIAIDILATIILLFFFLTGWRNGFLVSALGVARVFLAYGGAYFAGRYLGSWMGLLTHRPRIVTVPICAFMAFAVITFAFHVFRSELRARHAQKEDKENFQHPVLSSLSGGAVSLTSGTLSLVLLFWLGDVFLVGICGSPIPGANKAYFGRFARRTVYEAASFVIPNKSNKQQADAIARMISNPANGLDSLEAVLSAESIKRLVTDKQFADDLLSGDPARIEQNASIQQLFADRATLDELREIGVFSGYETKSGICERIAAIGSNEQIRISIESLRTRQLLSTDKIPLLLRDQEFDRILGELLK